MKKDEFDVVFIGSGISSLACASILSRNGKKVLILEQNTNIGGCCSSFTQMDYTFNVGVQDVSGIWKKGMLKYFLNTLALECTDIFVENDAWYILNGVKIYIPHKLNEIVKSLIDFFPQEKHSIEIFFKDVERLYEESIYTLRKEFNKETDQDFVKILGDKIKVNDDFKIWKDKTYDEILNYYFKNQDLKKILCALVPYTGMSKDEISAINALIMCLAYYIKGGYSIKGGSQNLADKLRHIIEASGGKIILGQCVEEILIKDNSVYAISCNSEIINSTTVVSNVNPKNTFLKLIKKEHVHPEYRHNISKLNMSISCLAIYLGVSANLYQYPKIIKDIDNKWELHINSNTDTDLAPKGCASITIISYDDVKYSDFPERNTEKYIEIKNQLAQKIIEDVQTVIPEIKDNIVIKSIATPKTFERYLHLPQGSIYGFKIGINDSLPRIDSPIKGLYLLGASVLGPGVETAITSGMMCAQIIKNNVK